MSWKALGLFTIAGIWVLVINAIFTLFPLLHWLWAITFIVFSFFVFFVAIHFYITFKTRKEMRLANQSRISRKCPKCGSKSVKSSLVSHLSGVDQDGQRAVGFLEYGFCYECDSKLKSFKSQAWSFAEENTWKEKVENG